MRDFAHSKVPRFLMAPTGGLSGRQSPEDLMPTAKSTPMIKQYLAIKAQFPDAILFYRMGDFYEMFFDDAEIASRALEITLTSRNKQDKVPVPMCGVPFRAANGYIARLIEQGHKVAICDQVEDPSQAKGLVKREVVRVVTPGTLIEDDLLNAKQANFVLALARNKTQLGIAYVDISTGNFRLAETAKPDVIREEILRVDPRELLLPANAPEDELLGPLCRQIQNQAVTYLESSLFRFGSGRERLLQQFQTLSLEGFGCESAQAGVGAAGALLHYVQDTQKKALEHIDRLETYGLDNFLVVDEMTCRNLEIMGNLRTGKTQGSLLGVIDATVTAMGGRLLKQWIRYPLKSYTPINHRHEAVAEAVHQYGPREDLRALLKSVADLERLSGKLAMGHGNARDLLALKKSLQRLPAMELHVDEFNTPLLRWPEDLARSEDRDELQTLATIIEASIREDAPPTINEGGLIKPEYDEDLAQLINISRDGKSWLARLEAQEREQTGITALKVRFNKVFGYFIEVPKARSAETPDHYVRKQTLVNAERYITDELKQFEDKVMNAEEQRAKMELALFQKIRGEATSRRQLLKRVAAFMAQLDCLLGLAAVAADNNYQCPTMNREGRLVIEDGRHPVVEKLITGERFVPNTIRMDDEQSQILLITGPNMAGKSTVLRQVALIVLLAHMGSFVPARKAEINLTDRIFTRVGALDNLAAGQSTFMVEMQETANILNNATRRSLVILDEIGRGTSTFDGLSIAWAVAEYLHDHRKKGVKTLFATHYHELTELARLKSRVKNFNIAVKEWNEEIIFLRKLVPGGTNRSYGIQVARLAGVPLSVTRRARKILARIENGESLRSDDQSGSGGIGVPIGHEQLALFQRPEEKIVGKLKSLDLTQMTPIEALNLLNELQGELQAAPSSSAEPDSDSPATRR